jgi:RNA polymerase sigma-70 factor (ECF subfamily)
MPASSLDDPESPGRLILHRFEALATPHLASLHAFARRRTGDANDADDALQDTLARAWLSFEQLRDPSAIRAWLFSVLRTVLAERVRTRERRARLVPITHLENQYDEWAASGPGEPDAFVQRITRDELRTALEALPEEFAVAVELHDLHGFSYREIADITGAPPGTVTSRIARGRRLLVALLGEARSGELAGDGQRPLPGMRGKPT